MILIGDKIIPYEELSFVDSIADIEHTLANSTIIFSYDENLLLYCSKNSLNFAVIVNSIKEAIYCNALNSKYIICEKKLAKTIQKLADNYIFDSRVLAIIDDNTEIEKIALNEIDGVIYSSLLIGE
ncbi:hypothetical protein CP965_02455 [Halarcobacter mediterraneus]|uniref:Uncharacterized protein n=1 Tax=Halarcobacter mediterraneus TaxID=2023153 RepID=A0A4Q1B5C3_9BACT|nr:hypothetical protein [Halarcobacter mediterraneus]RXK14327.1 hypothetical protein CP965_02455 [Halarcobacter mediterraneus]